jgi:hypothetical protein
MLKAADVLRQTIKAGFNQYQGSTTGPYARA